MMLPDNDVTAAVMLVELDCIDVLVWLTRIQMVILCLVVGCITSWLTTWSLARCNYLVV